MGLALTERKLSFRCIRNRSWPRNYGRSVRYSIESSLREVCIRHRCNVPYDCNFSYSHEITVEATVKVSQKGFVVERNFGLTRGYPRFHFSIVVASFQEPRLEGGVVGLSPGDFVVTGALPLQRALR